MVSDLREKSNELPGHCPPLLMDETSSAQVVSMAGDPTSGVKTIELENQT